MAKVSAPLGGFSELNRSCLGAGSAPEATAHRRALARRMFKAASALPRSTRCFGLDPPTGVSANGKRSLPGIRPWQLVVPDERRHSEWVRQGTWDARGTALTAGPTARAGSPISLL